MKHSTAKSALPYESFTWRVCKAVGLLAVGAATGALLGSTQRGAPSEPAVAVRDDGVSPDVTAHTKKAERACPNATPQARVVRADVLPEDAPDPEREQQYRERQSKELLDLLRMHESNAAQFSINKDPEHILAQVVPYLQGAADAIAKTSPELAEELSAQVESTLCDAAARPSLHLTMLRFAGALPDVGTQKGFDCVFSRPGGAEDVVTWAALDTWRSKGLDKSAAMEELERNAKDPRTLDRLTNRDVEMRTAGLQPLQSAPESAESELGTN